MANFLKIIWFRSKVLAVLKNDMQYEPAVPGFQQEAFNTITREMLDASGNDYDAAIAFLVVQLNVLLENAEMESDLTSKRQTANFILDKISKINRARIRSTGVSEEWLQELTSSEKYNAILKISKW